MNVPKPGQHIQGIEKEYLLTEFEEILAQETTDLQETFEQLERAHKVLQAGLE